MAFFLPVDLFTPYVEGQRKAVKDNWDDLFNYEKVVNDRLQNQYSAGTIDARIADTNNKAYDNYLNYSVNERMHPGRIAQADIFNLNAIDSLTVASDPANRRRNMNNMINQLYGITPSGGSASSGASSSVNGATSKGLFQLPQIGAPASASSNGGVPASTVVARVPEVIEPTTTQVPKLPHTSTPPLPVQQDMVVWADNNRKYLRDKYGQSYGDTGKLSSIPQGMSPQEAAMAIAVGDYDPPANMFGSKHVNYYPERSVIGRRGPGLRAQRNSAQDSLWEFQVEEGLKVNKYDPYTTYLGGK